MKIVVPINIDTASPPESFEEVHEEIKYMWCEIADILQRVRELETRNEDEDNSH